MIFYLIFFLLVLIYYYYFYNPKIKFLSKSEGCRVLKYKPYFDNFNQYDLKVRNCKDKNQCMNHYCKNVKSFSSKEKKVITNFINKVKNHPFLKPYNWKFIRVKDIENSYPHTQKECIVISDIFMNEIIEHQGSSTLIHEQIHVIQRVAANKMNQHLEQVLNFKPIKKLDGIEKYISRMRSNPDEDPKQLWIYKDSVLPLCLYHQEPNQLNDASYYGLKINNNEVISELIPLHYFKEYEHLKLGKNYYNAYEVQAEYLEQQISKDIFG